MEDKCFDVRINEYVEAIEDCEDHHHYCGCDLHQECTCKNP